MSESSSLETRSEIRCPYCNSPRAARAAQDEAIHCTECGGSFRWVTPTDATTVDEVRTLGKFQLFECVGQGSFGAVWRARDTTLGRPVALKIPHQNSLDSANFLERFRREAQAVAQLRHPGIVPVHEVLEVGGIPVIVSDYINGLPLTKVMELRRLTFRESAALIRDVADALDYAHTQGLVHRDIKPANILIEMVETSPKPTDFVGKPLVVDFGVALRQEADVALTIDGQLIGTPMYMSPEQAAGRGHQADRRSDVYSLGVVLYHLLCGEPPFRGSRTMLLFQVIHEQPRPPRRLNDRIPRDLETICLKALAKEPAWRYPTAGELAEEIRRYLRGEPILARPLGPAPRIWRWCCRNKALAIASGMAAAALLSLFVLAVAFALRERSNANQLAGALQESDAHLREAEYRLAENYLNRGLALCEQNHVGSGLLRLAKALNSAPPDARELRHYLRLSLGAWQSSQCSLQACLDHPTDVCTVYFCPDGTSCMTLSFDGSCRCWDVATGDPKGPPRRPLKPFAAVSVGTSMVVTGHADGSVERWALPTFQSNSPPMRVEGRVRAVAMSPDGSTILAGGDGGKVTLWRLPSGVLSTQTLSQEGEVCCVAVSPDGKSCLTGGEDRTARLWDTASGRLLHTFPHDDVVSCLAFGREGTVIATGCYNGSVRLWDTASGKSLPFHVRQEHLIRKVAVSPDGKFVLTSSSDRRARLWSVDTNDLIGSPLLHSGEVRQVAFALNGARVATCAERCVRLWSLPEAKVALEAPAQGWVRTLEFSSDGNTLISGDGRQGVEGYGRLWDAFTGKLQSTLLVHKDLVVKARFSPDNRTVATSGADGTVRLADAKTGRPGSVLPHAGSAYVVVFSPKGDLVLTGGEDRMAHLWDTQTGKLVGEAPAGRGPVTTGEFSPAGDLFFTGNYDGRFCLWRTADHALLFLADRPDPILAAAFSHDGKRILVSEGKQVSLFDVSRRAFIDPPLTRSRLIRAVAFSPDDRLALVAGEDCTAQLWDANSLGAQGVKFSHTLPVTVALFSPDGHLVLTGCMDGMARLWDVETGRPVGPALPHRGQVSCAAFSPDGGRFATGSSNRRGWLWKTPQVWNGEPTEVQRRVEVLTGMRLDDQDTDRVLDAAEWQDLSHRFGTE